MKRRSRKSQLLIFHECPSQKRRNLRKERRIKLKNSVLILSKLSTVIFPENKIKNYTKESSGLA